MTRSRRQEKKEEKETGDALSGQLISHNKQSLREADNKQMSFTNGKGDKKISFYYCNFVNLESYVPLKLTF